VTPRVDTSQAARARQTTTPGVWLARRERAIGRRLRGAGHPREPASAGRPRPRSSAGSGGGLPGKASPFGSGCPGIAVGMMSGGARTGSRFWLDFGSPRSVTPPSATLTKLCSDDTHVGAAEGSVIVRFVAGSNPASPTIRTVSFRIPTTYRSAPLPVTGQSPTEGGTLVPWPRAGPPPWRARSGS
jgi:hypothetical protein